MDFTSDNVHGAIPEILAAISSANSGAQRSYGNDDLTRALQEKMSEVFEREVAVFPVVTGTAANALALATFVPPHGSVICHAEAHIAVDECGAPEFFTHGAKLVPLTGENGKLSEEDVSGAISGFHVGDVHRVQPSAVSITQATECGTCYAMPEVAAIAEIAHRHGLMLHMDGARFANAVAHLGVSPADATWRAGVDVLSFGATKNGALCAEAAVFFDPATVRDFEYRRKKSGHLVSKMRFLSAQWLAYLENGRWIDSARQANGAAANLARLLSDIREIEIAYPVEANAVFAHVPDRTIARLRDNGARFYNWGPSIEGRSLIRLVCSFATRDDDIARFADVAGSD